MWKKEEVDRTGKDRIYIDERPGAKVTTLGHAASSQRRQYQFCDSILNYDMDSSRWDVVFDPALHQCISLGPESARQLPLSSVRKLGQIAALPGY